jgi:hypothetical protein
LGDARAAGRLRRVVFFSAKPLQDAAFDALRTEAAQKGDLVVLPGVFEAYSNITHQTLEIFRAASLDPLTTHVLKARGMHLIRDGHAAALHRGPS